MNLEIFRSICLTILMIVVPIFFVISVTYITRNTNALLLRMFGFNSQIFLGFLGIIVHELSHLIVAILFGHRITDFRLLVLPWNVDRNSSKPVLGYVNDEWNDNSFYQRIGNVFEGVAPVFGCTLAIYLVISFCFPGLLTSLDSINLSNSFLSVINIFASLIGTDIVTKIVGILLILNITIGGFALSDADINSSKRALIELIGLFSIIVTILLFFGWSYLVNYWLLNVLKIFIRIAVLPLTCVIGINIILRLLLVFTKDR